jgi:drug/metabolite transporter (DMT)-like permease
MSRSKESRRAWIAWGAVCVIWGTTYLAIKLALETIPPFLIGGLRYIVAGALLGAVLWSRGDRIPPRRTWAGFLLLGLLMFGVGNGGVVWAEVWVPSGLAAVVIATTPFWMVGVEALLPHGERLTWRHAAGLATGFGGILLLVGPALLRGGGDARRTLAGVVALQLACAGWAVGSAYGKRHAARVTPGMSAAAQMLCGGLVMLAAGSALGEWADLRFSTGSTAALIYLTLAGSIAGFGAYIYALSHLPVSIVSLYAYINPIIAVSLGTLLLGERFDLRMLVAIGIVLAGLAVVSRARQAPNPGAGRASTQPVGDTRAAAGRPSR